MARDTKAEEKARKSILSSLEGGSLSPELGGEARTLLGKFDEAGKEGKLFGEFGLFNIGKKFNPLATRIEAELGRKKTEFEARRKETTRFRTGRSSTVFAGGQQTIAPQQGTASTLLGL